MSEAQGTTDPEAKSFAICRVPMYKPPGKFSSWRSIFWKSSRASIALAVAVLSRIDSLHAARTHEHWQTHVHGEGGTFIGRPLGIKAEQTVSDMSGHAGMLATESADLCKQGNNPKQRCPVAANGREACGSACLRWGKSDQACGNVKHGQQREETYGCC